MALMKKTFENDESELGGDDTVAAGDPGAGTVAASADDRVAAALAKKAAADSKPADKSADKEVSKSTEVATAPKAGSLAVAMSQADPFTKLENAIHVDYNTLTRIMVTNGNVQNKDTKKLMGESCVLELISIQKHWVMSPGGDSKDEESFEFLKYSDDGKTVRDTGELLTVYRDAAIAAGYDKARIVERLILVGMLVDAGKLSDEMNGELVQLDCAPRSMSNFHRHRISTAFRIGKGLQTAAGAEVVKITCDVQSKGANNWTDAVFSSVK